MEKLKQIAYKEVSKIPMVQHLFWKAKDKFQAKINVVTMSEATGLTLKWIKQLSNDYDCIIGIPRSGLWVAGIIALKLGLPLSTPTSFMRGESWYTLHLPLKKFKKILLVEDDVLYGKQLLKHKRSLQAFNPDLKIETASLFATSNGSRLVDYYYQVRNPPLLYEWTLLTNMARIGKLAVDLDGVLCKEDSSEPYLIPKFPIEAVITSRPETQRILTMDWLIRNNVSYKSLEMLSTPERNLAIFIDHKVEVLEKVRPFWFWESEPAQATAIHSKTHIPVLCTATMELLL